ncbi:1,4-dihydroxy-2-naphthoate polyprenyltransferase [Lactobacillus sp. YT155]|uniref:1,4-dihydroxy-2-naphthoate polyprenyltransferase n=1 Tax=Lactobacillus sp. YT155 TaxID=3060955 RepID=UPI00265FA2C7|nr:1,4-dihydroxy-2-naphthoate polyprenyltransferase [Lactobacillus sp. YT155]MDO1605504.1 1,4-dihydroxy-2-naphthoate polyprenyltransferase [Lactobacillus sp. YT155]
MNLKIFLELVEAKTKLASILPFFVGTFFTFAYFNQFDLLNSVLFFFSMLVFDMTTTAINNLMDYLKAKDNNYKFKVNLIGREKVSVSLVKGIIISMLLFSTIVGIVLVRLSNLSLLYLGVLCFIIGIFYTYGPLPLSRLPLGEAFSGITLGLGIPLITVIVNTHENVFLASGKDWLAIILVCVTPVATIANIMLANNLSDIDQDIKNERRTLPILVGKKLCIKLYQFLAYAGYLAIILLLIFKIAEWPILLGFLSLVPVVKNVTIFSAKQSKAKTFPTSIQNLVFENISLVIAIGAWIILK